MTEKEMASHQLHTEVIKLLPLLHDKDYKKAEMVINDIQTLIKHIRRIEAK